MEAREVDVLVSDLGEAAHGMSLVDGRKARASITGTSITVLMSVDGARFKEALHERLRVGAATLLSPASECRAGKEEL